MEAPIFKTISMLSKTQTKDWLVQVQVTSRSAQKAEISSDETHLISLERIQLTGDLRLRQAI